jgi:hypothetical protein
VGAKCKERLVSVTQCRKPWKTQFRVKTEQKPGLICNTLGYLLAVSVRDRLQENVVSSRVHMVPHYKNKFPNFNCCWFGRKWSLSLTDTILLQNQEVFTYPHQDTEALGNKLLVSKTRYQVRWNAVVGYGKDLATKQSKPNQTKPRAERPKELFHVLNSRPEFAPKHKRTSHIPAPISWRTDSAPPAPRIWSTNQHVVTGSEHRCVCQPVRQL